MTLGYTYDTGALIAAERGDQRVWALHEACLNAGLLATVPAGVLAQAWRGGPQDRLSRMLKGCVVEPFGEARARSAGTLCARADRADVVHASLVLGAAIRGDAVVTSDPGDLQALSQALGVDVPVIDL